MKRGRSGSNPGGKVEPMHGFLNRDAKEMPPDYGVVPPGLGVVAPPVVPPPVVLPAGGVVAGGDVGVVAGGVVGVVVEDDDGDGLLEPLWPLHAVSMNANASASVTKGMRRMWVLLYSSLPSISDLPREARTGPHDKCRSDEKVHRSNDILLNLSAQTSFDSRIACAFVCNPTVVY